MEEEATLLPVMQREREREREEGIREERGGGY